MSALSALDVRPLASLYATRHVLLRALMTAFLPLGVGWLAFVYAFNSVEVRVDDSDFGPKLAMVGLFALPYAVGHVIGLCVGELSSHPLTRLLPARLPRVRRASLVIGVAASLLTTLALLPLTSDVSFLAAYAAGGFGYALGDASCSVPRRASVWAAAIVAVFMLLSNMNLVLEWLDGHPLRSVAVIAAAIPLHGLPFTRFGDRPYPERSVPSGAIRPSPRPVAPSASAFERALTAERYESAPSLLRGELRPLLQLALFFVVLSSAGPLAAAALDRAPEGDALTLLERLFEALVGRAADGSIPGQGTAGTSAALAFGFGVLPLTAAQPFRGATMRPFSRATLGRLAFRVWWRTTVRGTLALAGVALLTTLLIGWFADAGLPAHVPVFVKCAVLLAPLVPWLTIVAIVARRWAKEGSGLEVVTVTAAFTLAFLVAGACVVVARNRDYDEILTPTPLTTIAYVVALGLGVAALRAFYARHYRSAPIAPA